MAITLRGNADSDFDNSVTIDRANAADACVRVQQAGTTNLTLFANGSIDCSGIVVGDGGMTLNGVPTRNAWAQNEVIQTRLFQDNGIGAFSNTAWGSAQDANFSFTPRSTDSTICIEYTWLGQSVNVASVNTSVSWRINSGFGLGHTTVLRSSSSSGDDGVQAPCALMSFFNNTSTNAVNNIRLERAASGSGGNGTVGPIRCKITEIQN